MEHLGDQRVYKRISKQEAERRQQSLRLQLQLWLKDFELSLPENERTYLQRAIKKYPFKLARFRMMLKAHKIP